MSTKRLSTVSCIWSNLLCHSRYCFWSSRVIMIWLICQVGPMNLQKRPGRWNAFVMVPTFSFVEKWSIDSLCSDVIKYQHLKTYCSICSSKCSKAIYCTFLDYKNPVKSTCGEKQVGFGKRLDGSRESQLEKLVASWLDNDFWIILVSLESKSIE